MSLTRVKDLSSATKLTVDTNTLHADETNNRVGVGTASPSQRLHVEGAGNQFILINNSSTNDGMYLKAGSGASSIQTNAGSNVLNFFTSGTERMEIDSNGHIRKFSQPSFRAGTTSGYATGASPTTVVCSNVQHNIGNGYNSSNGTYTVPSPGTWLFGVHGNARDVGSSQASSVYAQIMKNGSRMAIYYNSDEPNSSWHQIQGVIILECATNDAITFSSGPYTYWDSSMWTQFYGYLLG